DAVGIAGRSKVAVLGFDGSVDLDRAVPADHNGVPCPVAHPDARMPWDPRVVGGGESAVFGRLGEGDLARAPVDGVAFGHGAVHVHREAARKHRVFGQEEDRLLAVARADLLAFDGYGDLGVYV